MKKPILIGLCGRSGTGKGYVCKLFARLGIPSVDTDAVYRDMTAPSDTLSPCMQELIDTFGETIRLPDNSLNRQALSAIVFGDGGGEALKTLNRITHAYILAETKRLAQEYAEAGADMVIIDAPVLFESGFDAMCRFTVCVCASEETSVTRILKRDGITREAALRRLASQIPTEELMRRCDFHIENELQCDTLTEQTERIAAQMRAALGESL